MLEHFFMINMVAILMGEISVHLYYYVYVCRDGDNSNQVKTPSMILQS